MSDIVDNPEEYFGRLVPQRDQLLIDLEAEAQQEEIPIIGPVVGQLLFVLACATGAGRILELGTATGYSTIFLARACRNLNGSVLTLENDRSLADRARVNFQKAGLEEFIEVRVGDALEEIASLDEDFDLIFIDIEKEDYIRALPHIQRLLKKGGLLFADNVGFKDADAFNQAIAGSLEWRSVSLFAFLPRHSPEYDGLCIAIKL
jgi:predicted O-methyltransferase YrrM